MDLGVDLPDEAKKPIDDAKKSIQTAVDAGNFVISVNIFSWKQKQDNLNLKVPINDGGAPGSVNSTASKLIEIDSRPGNNNRHGPHVSYVKGYTSGEFQEKKIGFVRKF